MDANITVSGIGRGIGISGGAANDRYNATSWNSATLSATKYFEFTLTPNAGYQLNFTSIVYTGQASGTGATSVALRSSIDGYASNIGTANITGTTLSLSAAAYQSITSAITFRLYGWGASAAGGTFSINSFTFNGTVVSSASPTIAISSTPPAAANVNTGSTVVLQQYALAVSAVNATLNGLTVSTNGTYINTDLTNLKVRYSTDAVLDAGDATLSTFTTPGIAGVKAFPTFSSQTILSGSTGYLFITADIAVGATAGNSIHLGTNVLSNFSFSSGTRSGTDPAVAGGIQTFVIPIVVPSLTLPVVSAISTTSATLGATITSNGGATISQRGTVWGTAVNPTTNQLAEGGTAVSGFSHSRTGLVPNTFYYYRGYALNSAGYGYSTNGSFTTLQTAPGSLTANSIQYDGFTLSWTAPGNGAAAFTYQFQIDSDNAFGSPDVDQNAISSGTLTQNITGLVTNTPYYIRIRSVNAGGNGPWSGVVGPITPVALPEPANQATAFSCGITGVTSIPLSWIDATGSPAATAYLIRWSVLGDAAIPVPTDGIFTANGVDALNVSAGDQTATISGLVGNTTYFFRIYAYTNSGTWVNYNTTTAPQSSCTTLDGACQTEDFTTIGSSATYGTRTWSGSGGTWTATDAREDQTITGKAITIRNGTLLSPTLSGGISQIRLKTQRKFAGVTGTMNVLVNGNTVGTIAYDGTVQTVVLSGINVTGNYTLEILSPSGSGDRVALDDLEIFCFAGTCTVSNPTVITATAGNASASIGWSTPTCSDEVLVVVREASAVTAVPSGNGSVYVSSAVWGAGGSGAGLPINEFTVYQGSGTLVNVSSLANGTLYHVTVFSRKGNLWSTGISSSFVPSLYCIPSISNACDEYISKVETGSISNSTGESCGNNGYSNFSNLQTTVSKGQTYSITVQVGIVGDAADVSYLNDDIRVWADWNQDGDFLDGNETLQSSNNNGAAGSFNITIPLTANSGIVCFRVRLVYDDETSPCGIATYGETEDYSFNVIPPCTPVATISSFLPINGPAGTRVTITGSGFTGASAFNFNGIPAQQFSVMDATQIIAQVPEGAGTGVIGLVDNTGCSAFSATSFAYLSQTGSCSASYSELLISEVYDPQSGNNHYIELYNGTQQIINLNSPNNYTLKLFNKASATDPNPTSLSLDITGSIASEGILVVYAGSNGGLSTPVAQGFANGFNDYDEIQLLKNGIVIDQILGPNNIGYDYRRLNTVSGPNAVYTAAEWTRIEAAETIADIGNFTTSPSFNIILNPADAQSEPCDGFTLLVNADQSASYQWKVFTGSGTWVNLAPATGLTGYNTNTLTISPSLGYGNYQFYCEVSRALCQKQSDAVQFLQLPNTKTYFRSAASGIWTSPSVWEFATTSGGPWLPSCFYPTASTSDNIQIQSGHTITVSGADVILDQLIVDAGAGLILSNTDAITFADGPGVDFTINGTYTDNANSGAGNGVFMETNASWQMSATATFIKTNTSSFSVYRDQYVGGMAAIPSTATMIMRSISGSNPTFTAVGNTFYPNLIFESTAGVWNPTFASSRFNGLSDFPTIKGNLDIGGTGAGSVVIYNQNTNTNPLTVLGNLIIRNASTLTNAGTSVGTGFEVKGNISLVGTFTINSPNNTHYLKLSGATSQIISGAGTFNLANLIVQNSSTYGIDLQRDITVSNQLNMLDGHVQTGSHLLTLGTGLTSTGTLLRTDGFVIGIMRRWFNGTNTGNASGLFPMGVSAGTYRDHSVTLEYNTAATTGGYLTVEFINTPMAAVNSGLPILATNTGGAGFDVQYLEDEGYWKIDNQPGTLTDGLYTISLTGEAFQTVTDINQLTLLKRVGSGSWTCPGIHLATTGTTNLPIVSRSGVSGFSNFGFGSGGNNPLPVELLSFTAQPAGENIQLNWITGSEINAAWFEITRSKDAEHFEHFSRQSAVGNSTTHQYYQALDTEPETGISYYQLKQIDFNGDILKSDIIAVNLKQSDRDFISQVSFEPLTGMLIGQTTQTDGIIQLRVYDLTGRLLSERAFNAESSSFRIALPELNQRGVYVIHFSSLQKEHVVKVLR